MGIGIMVKNTPYKEVGDRLKLLRNNQNISQPQFATLLGISLRTYQRYEYGERLPGLKLLSKISEITLAAMDWIVWGQTLRESPFDEDDITEVFDKIDLLFNQGSYEIVSFFIKILDVAIQASNNTKFLNKEEAFVDFLIKVSGMASGEAGKLYEGRSRKIDQKEDKS